MYSPEGNKKTLDDTILIFLPVEVETYQQIFLHGEIKHLNGTITLYVTETCRRQCQNCLGEYKTECHSATTPVSSNWFHLERDAGGLILRAVKVDGKRWNGDSTDAVVVYYDRRVFYDCQDSLFMLESSNISRGDHFKILIKKLSSQKTGHRSRVFNYFQRLVQVFRYIILFLSACSRKLSFITKYSNIATHFDNYLTGLIWLTDPSRKEKRGNIKRLNCLLSLVLDLVLGAICLNYLTTHLTMKSVPKSVSSAEHIVQPLKNLIYWLTGDPAGFKLNQTFSKMLATFFIFYIDVWSIFITLVKPAYSIIFLVFMIIGRGGITFQVSIIADVLAIMTLHIYCICLFAARLYNIQTSALLALWRLFLGRKKNPLRGRVDSCKYTPEQLFIGTLGFTILLFLMPTTFVYYVVFTSLRLILSAIAGTLTRIRYFVLSFQIYSTALWLMGSPKVCSEIRLVPCGPPAKNHCLVFRGKPVCTSWRSTIIHDGPGYVDKPEEFRFLSFLYSLLVGSVKRE